MFREDGRGQKGQIMEEAEIDKSGSAVELIRAVMGMQERVGSRRKPARLQKSGQLSVSESI